MNRKLTQKLATPAVLSLVAVLASAASAHATMDETYSTITNVETHEVPTTATNETTMDDVKNVMTPSTETSAADPESGIPGIDDISNIINVGQQLWSIVQANQPVASVTTQSASALPQGITNWANLEGWQAPTTKSYETTFTNGFGMTVIDFTYDISFITGGSYDGKGQFLANITVIPRNVTVAWGYTFNAQVSIPTITNAGSLASPVAAAEVLVQWTVDTVIKHQEQSQAYYLRGDGQFEALK